MSKSNKKTPFLLAVLKLAIAFFAFVTVARVLFYLITMGYDDFKSYMTSEKSMRELIWAAMFAPVYGLLVTLFYRTVKKQ